jgi:hypothetical protein
MWIVPETLREAKPKAGSQTATSATGRMKSRGASVTASGPRTGTEAQKSNVQATPIRNSPFFDHLQVSHFRGRKTDHPDENKSGRPHWR